MWINRSIGHQIMAVVIGSFAIFSIGVAVVIGFQSYQDLEDLVYERTYGAARLFKSEYEGQIRRAHTALSSIEMNQLIAEHLTLLTQNGPLYIEDISNKEGNISESENSYYLQSQLKLANTLIMMLPQYGLSHISVYHLSPFNQFDNTIKLPSLVIDYEYVWLYRYYQKSGQPRSKVYRIPVSELSQDAQVFDVSSIYQHDADYFYDVLNIQATLDAPVDFLVNMPEEQYFSGRAIGSLNGLANISMWSSISLPLSNPKTWQTELQYSALVLGVILPSQDTLQIIGEQIGTNLAITNQDTVLVSSIEFETMKKSGHGLQLGDKPYVFSEVKLDLPNFSNDDFKVMALLSTEDLQNRTRALITRLSMITLIVLAITSALMYFLINLKLQSPLRSLLSSVKSVEKGDLEAKVELNTKNEFRTLSEAFNRMIDVLKRTSEDLRDANETLEQKVKDRTSDLIETQQQLIMSEKMASLGQLVAGIAHEINTPLGNSITALSFNKENFNHIKKLFEDKQVKTTDFAHYVAQTEDGLTLLEANLFKASELVTTFKRVAVDQSVEELCEFSMLQHIEEVLLTLRPKLKQQDIQINLDIEDGLVINSFPGTYYHIISNIVINCINHAFPDKQGNIHISVHTASNQECLSLILKDDGVGMDEQTKKKIFDPFYTTRRGAGGTGLGMYMTFNMVSQRLGGKIDIDTSLGQGVTFNITVPKTPPDDPPHANPFSI